MCLLFIHPRAPNLINLRSAGCAPQKVDPALIARVRPTIVGCFWPGFFFADHKQFAVLCRPVKRPRLSKVDRGLGNCKA